MHLIFIAQTCGDNVSHIHNTEKIHPQMQHALRLQLLLLNKRISLTQRAQRCTCSHALVIRALESL